MSNKNSSSRKRNENALPQAHKNIFKLKEELIKINLNLNPDFYKYLNTDTITKNEIWKCNFRKNGFSCRSTIIFKGKTLISTEKHSPNCGNRTRYCKSKIKETKEHKNVKSKIKQMHKSKPKKLKTNKTSISECKHIFNFLVNEENFISENKIEDDNDVNIIKENFQIKDNYLNEILAYLTKLSYPNVAKGHIIISGKPRTGKTAFANNLLKNLEKLIDEGDLLEYNLIKLDVAEIKNKEFIYEKLFNLLFFRCETNDQETNYHFSAINNYFRFSQLEGGLELKMLKTDIYIIVIDHFELLNEEDQLHMKNLFNWIRNIAFTIIVIVLTNNKEVFYNISAMIENKHIFKHLTFEY
jgi:Cdc6-like AAA superfamily ATPase